MYADLYISEILLYILMDISEIDKSASLRSDLCDEVAVSASNSRQCSLHIQLCSYRAIQCNYDCFIVVRLLAVLVYF